MNLPEDGINQLNLTKQDAKRFMLFVDLAYHSGLAEFRFRNHTLPVPVALVLVKRMIESGFITYKRRTWIRN